MNGVLIFFRNHHQLHLRIVRLVFRFQIRGGSGTLMHQELKIIFYSPLFEFTLRSQPEAD